MNLSQGSILKNPIIEACNAYIVTAEGKQKEVVEQNNTDFVERIFYYIKMGQPSQN